MNKKRGQITLFIIIGIVLLFITFLFFYISSEVTRIRLESELKEQQVISFEQLDKFISLCIEKSSAEGGYHISRLGGWHIVPSDKVLLGIGYPIAKVYDNTKPDNEKKIFLSLSEVEEQYANYVEENILKCVDGFNIFKDGGYKITYENPIVEVKTLQNFSIVKTNFPVIAVKGDTKKKFFEFPPVNVPLRIGRFYEISKDIVDMTYNNPGIIDITYLMNLGQEAISYYNYYNNERTDLYYVFVDELDTLYSKKHNNGINYRFIIGEKFR